MEERNFLKRQVEMLCVAERIVRVQIKASWGGGGKEVDEYVTTREANPTRDGLPSTKGKSPIKRVAS